MPRPKITYTLRNPEGKTLQIEQDEFDNNQDAYIEDNPDVSIRMRGEDGDYYVPLGDYKNAMVDGYHAFTMQHGYYDKPNKPVAETHPKASSQPVSAPVQQQSATSQDVEPKQEEQPQQEQAAKPQGMSDAERGQFMADNFGFMMGAQRKNNAMMGNIGRMQQQSTVQGRQQQRATETALRTMGVETKPNVVLSVGGSEDGGQDGAQPQQKKSVVTQSPQAVGVTYDENGNAQTQWQLNDGSLTSDQRTADQAEAAARRGRLQQAFTDRMHENGLDPEKQEDVAKQAELDRTEPLRRAMEQAWADYEATAKDKFKAGMPSVEDHPMLNNGKYLTGLEIAADIDKQAHQFERVSQDAINRMPKDVRDAMLGQYAQYYKQNKNELKGRSVEQAAQDALVSDVYGMMYDKAKQEAAPKNTLDYLVKRASAHQIWNPQTWIDKAASTMSGDDSYVAAKEAAMNEYGQDHKWANVGGTVANMALDPVTYVAGGVGSWAGRAATSMAGRVMLKGGADAAERFAAATLTGRIVGGVAGGSANLATFEALKDVQDQFEHGGHINENGENEGYSVGNVLKQGLHGGLLGSATGFTGAIIGNVADKAVKTTRSTAGKVGTRAGFTAVSTLAEGTVFAAPDIINDWDPSKSVEENGAKAWDTWTDSQAMMIGFKASHAIKSVGNVLKDLKGDGERHGVSFEERVRKRMDSSPRDMGFSTDEEAELIINGYGDFAELYKKKTEPKAPKVKSTDLSMNRADIDGYEQLDKSPIDGYETLERLMADGRVSEAARAKAYYMATGRMVPMSTVVGYTTDTAADGRTIVRSVNSKGEVVTCRSFETEKDAQQEMDNIARTAELNTINVGEDFTDRMADMMAVEQAINEVSPGADVKIVMDNYKRVKAGEEDAVKNYGWQVEAIDQALERNRESTALNKSAAIRERIESETGINVDAAIRKMPSKRTAEEQETVARYARELYKNSKESQEKAAEEQQAEADRQRSYEEGRNAYAQAEEQQRLLEGARQEPSVDENGRPVPPSSDGGADVGQGNSVVDGMVERAKAARDEVLDTMGDEAEEIIADLDEDPLGALMRVPESQREVALEYVNAMAAVNGYSEAAAEGLAAKKDAIVAGVNKRVNKTESERTGTPVSQTATLRETIKDEDGNDVKDAMGNALHKQAYVVSGTIKRNADGAIIKEESDSAILTYNSEEDKYEFVDIGDIEGLGEYVDAQQEIDEALGAADAENETLTAGLKRIDEERARAASYAPVDPKKLGAVVFGGGDPMREGLADSPYLKRYVPLSKGDYTLTTKDGEQVRATVTPDQFGGYEVKSDVPLKAGQTENYFSAEELAAFNPTEAGTDMSADDVRQGTDIVAGTEEPQTIADTTEEPEHTPTPLERIPVAEDGTPQFAHPDVDTDTAYDGIVEYMEDADVAQEYAEGMVAQARNAVKAMEKKKVSFNGNPAAFKQAKQQQAAELAAAQEQLERWEQIAGVRKMREEAEQIRQNHERMEAEQARRDHERAEQEKALAALAEQKRIEAEKAAEQEALGAHNVSPQIAEKWNNAPKVHGGDDVKILPDGTRLEGHYVLAEAGSATASHDPGNAFAPTEGFPRDEKGKSVNDRDYERDTHAQEKVRTMAGSFDGRALQSVPTVSSKGVVYDGNNRTMSGDMAAKNGTDGGYVADLMERPEKYGFTREQVESMQHPRVYFELNEDLPYDAATFARFNAEEKKKMNVAESAVKMGKMVPDDTFNRVTRLIGKYDRLSDFYGNTKDSGSVLTELRSAGVINDNDLPQLRNGDALTAQGRELVENVLIGKALDSKPDAVRQLAAHPGVKQGVVMALSEIVHNRTLGAEYGIGEEIGNAIDLVVRAKAEDSVTYADGKPVSGYGRQQGLFDEELGDSRVTDLTTLMLADVMNSGKPSDLRKVLAMYNQAAQEAAAGQVEMFSGEVRSKEDILKDITEQYRNATRREQDKLAAAAVGKRKQSATEAEQAPAAGLGGETGEGRGTNGGLDSDRARVERHNKIATHLGGKYGFSSEEAKNGEVFMQDENGRTELTAIPDEIFDKIGLLPVPFKLTETMAWHVYDHHAGDLKLQDIDEAIDFVLNIIDNVDHVRLGREGSYIFSIENGRRKRGQRAVAIIVDGKSGDFIGIRTAGYEDIKHIKERPSLWTRGAHAASEDVATPSVSTIAAQNSDEHTSSTEGQKKASEGKGTNNSANGQENVPNIANTNEEIASQPIGATSAPAKVKPVSQEDGQPKNDTKVAAAQQKLADIINSHIKGINAKPEHFDVSEDGGAYTADISGSAPWSQRLIEGMGKMSEAERGELQAQILGVRDELNASTKPTAEPKADKPSQGSVTGRLFDSDEYSKAYVRQGYERLAQLKRETLTKTGKKVAASFVKQYPDGRVFGVFDAGTGKFLGFAKTAREAYNTALYNDAETFDVMYADTKKNTSDYDTFSLYDGDSSDSVRDAGGALREDVKQRVADKIGTLKDNVDRHIAERNSQHEEALTKKMQSHDETIAKYSGASSDELDKVHRENEARMDSFIDEFGKTGRTVSTMTPEEANEWQTMLGVNEALRELLTRPPKETAAPANGMKFEGDVSEEDANMVSESPRQLMMFDEHGEALVHTGGLPTLEPGEFSYVERQFNDNGYFQFSGGKIESANDVAYILRNLEDKAVENAFAVLVTDSKPTVVHLGMGGFTETYANIAAIRAAVDKYGAEKIYFVHNHPSGNLVSSRQDRMLMEKLRNAFGTKLQDGIIIDTKSGKYGTFNTSGDLSSWNRPTESNGDEQPVAVKVFDKLVFSKDYDVSKLQKVVGSEDIAAFVSSQRLGERKKVGLILLDNQLQIVGNLHLPYSGLDSDVEGLANEIARVTISGGGRVVVPYGNFNISGTETNVLNDKIRKLTGDTISLLDAISSDGTQFASARDKGYFFGEEQAKYDQGKDIQKAIAEEDGKRVDFQGNAIDENGKLITEKISSIDELTDEDFTEPTRSVELPTLPRNITDAIGSNKPVVIKKNIFAKNASRHGFTPQQSRDILRSALYNPDIVGQSQPSSKPNHWVAIKLGEESPITILEVNENKDNTEIVGWYRLDDRNLGRIRRQAEREGGELLMLSPRNGVGSLSTPTQDLSSDGKGTEKSSNEQEIGGESVEKVRIPVSYHDVKEFADKYDLPQVYVGSFARYMERGDLAGANAAYYDMRRSHKAAWREARKMDKPENPFAPLSAYAKVWKPIEKELYERFGNLDELQAEAMRKAEEERGLMEAAKKKAQEEAEARQKRLDELADLSEEEIDKRYADALSENDEATAREMLDEVARRRGYGDEHSDYQGVGAWPAPADPGYTKEQRRAELESSGSDINIEDIAEGFNIQPDDFFDNPRGYGYERHEGGIESRDAIREAVEKIKRGEKASVKVYRAVPTSIKEGSVRSGDWVTPSKAYAELHGESRFGGKYRVIEQDVPAEQLWWDGNDIREWGFDDGKVYKHKNVKNNRKSNELVTRDDKGNVIPPSKRFNQRKEDLRFRDGEEDIFNFSDEELARRMTAIEAIKPTEIAEYTATKQEANQAYTEIGDAVNKNDGRKVTFYASAFKKIFKQDGLFQKAIPGLKDAFENSVLAFSEPDNLGGTIRPDNTEHKEHKNIVAFHHYIGKVKIGDKEYYVRYFVQEERSGSSGTHGFFVSNAEIYEKQPQRGATLPITTRGTDFNEVADAKLQHFFENAKVAREKVASADENIRTRLVSEGELLEFLNGQPTRKGFRYAQWANHGVLPPMTAKQNGEWRAPMVFNRWEQSEELPRKGNGKVDLVQGNGRTTGNVAYNPYFHIRNGSPLNDQFTAAYDRPELLVIEGEYPESELTSGYHADGAKNSVGLMDWHSGSVNGQLSEDTKVQTMLSRYFKARRIVPWSEAAENIMERVGNQKVVFPINSVPPMLRAELAKRGAKFGAISGSVAEEDIPMLNDLIRRVNSGEWDAGLEKAREYEKAYESSDNAKAAAVAELSDILHTPVTLISDPAEVAKLPSYRQRRAKGWYDEKSDEVVVVAPNNVNVADIENTVLHEVVGHDGLRELVGEENYDRFLDEVYSHAGAPIAKKIDAMVDKMIANERDRILDRKMQEGDDGIMAHAEATVEAEEKREKFTREATDEYMSDLGGRIGKEGFEKMEAEELTFWGKIKERVMKFLDKFFKGLGIPKGIKLTDKDLSYILFKSWQKKKNGGKMSMMDVAEDVDMRERTGYNMKDEVRFRDGEMGLDETITKMKAETAAKNAEDFEARTEAMKAIGGNLQKLRSAMARQKAYDVSTVKAISDLADVMMKNGLLNSLSTYEMKRVMSAVKNSVGKEDLSGSVNQMMDIMINNQLSHGERVWGNLMRLGRGKVNGKGVVTIGALDANGAAMVQAAKRYTALSADAMDERMADLLDRMGDSDQTIADNAAIEYDGLQIARRYVEEITESKAEEKELRASLKEAKEDYAAGKMDYEAYKEFKRATEEAIMQNRIERAEAYTSIAEQVGGKLGESAERAKAWHEAEKERINEIRHNCNSDMQGKVSDEHRAANIGKEHPILNSSAVRFFLSPLGTFDQMLRMLGEKNVNGEGYLWNRFMRGWADASEGEYVGYRDALKELDDKVGEIVGDGKKWRDLFGMERKMPKAYVEFWDGGEKKMHELTQGNMLYIYMVNKMTDGRMKLRKMGITDETVERITEMTDPRFIELADWMQQEFLVEKRNKYNEVHKRMFGAPMAAIDNYFPLKILQSDLDKQEDVMEDNDAGILMPGGTTGGIIKRTRNAKPLNVTGADAFNVILDHIQEMEHWASYAELTRDINTMLSYKRFRNQVKNMSSVYGSGDVLWKNFRNACKMAVGAYRPPVAELDKTAVNVAKGVTAAKVSARIFTAFKQMLSYPAYLPDTNPVTLMKNTVTPWKAWQWSMENLPLFEKRWKSRMAGDPRLLKTEMDWAAWRNKWVQTASKIGISPNAFVDAMTVSIGAYSIYESRVAKYKRWGFPDAVAERRAKQDATILYNSSQQSSEGAFLSTMQADRSWLSTLFTVFRNSAMSYTRQELQAARNLGKYLFKPEWRAQAEEYMAKQFAREGLTEEQAQNAAREEYRNGPLRNLVRLLTFGFALPALWNLGAYLPYMLLGDDKDKKADMAKDAMVHGLFGSVEGLTGGDVMSSALNMLSQGEVNERGLEKNMPLVSDVMSIISRKDGVQAANDCINLLVQAGLGLNPQSLTDAMVGILDACGDDAQTSREAAMLICRVFNVPQSQLDMIYFDELGLTGDEARRLTPAQLAHRYARYKRRRNTPFTGWMYDAEGRKAAEAKYKNKAMEVVKDNLAKATDGDAREELEGWRAEYEATAKKVKAINKLRSDGDEEEADKQEDALWKTPEYTRYDIMKSYNSEMNEISKMILRSKDPREAEQLTDTLTHMKASMAAELRKVK